jgi:hypothetical protein
VLEVVLQLLGEPLVVEDRVEFVVDAEAGFMQRDDSDLAGPRGIRARDARHGLADRGI